MLKKQTILNCRGKILSLESPIIMGIINTTPDSFYAGSRKTNLKSILKQAEQMLTAGAAIIDIGGMSSRPGAQAISVKEEINRTRPAIDAILKAFPESIISIDTVWADVAKAALDQGASIVNDISGGRIDPKLLPLVGQEHVPYVLMHMQNLPHTMQANPQYEDVTLEIMDFFNERITYLRSLGIVDIILDVGFGFGKTIDHNYQLLNNLETFNLLELPMLVGLSRKSMIYKLLETDAQNALNGTTALHIFALQKGANILRVHDVEPAMEVIRLWNKIDQLNNQVIGQSDGE